MPASTLPAPRSSSASPAGEREAPWQVLDDALEWSAFSKPVAGQPSCWESSVVFDGMHCAACAVTLEDALSAVPGVQSVTVSAASHRGRVIWSEATTRPSEWMRAAQRVGYRPVPANDVFASERRRAENRQMLWRWLVAGLCMMQVMMYATPAYVAGPGDMTPDMLQLLRWASWVLTLPVLLFSCGPFFRSALRDLRQRRISMDLPVAVGILVTFLGSTVGTFEPNGVFGREVYFDSLTMFVFFLLTGRWLELRLRDRTTGALEALMNRLPDSVERRGADGRYERVAVRRLVIGDVIRVLPGEAFPADGTVIEGQTLADEALLTGESHPLSRGEGQGVIAGSHNLSAPVLVRVERTGADTRFAQIVALMDSASTTKPRLAALADRVAKPFLGGVLVAAAAAAAFWWSKDPGHALMIAVAVLVVTCPCALSLATPAAMLASAGALARRGVLVRRLQALEALSTVDMVVFDKTGTLTRDAFVLEAMQTRPGVTREDALAFAAALARHSLHPVSRALLRAWRDTVATAVGEPWGARQLQEVAGQGVAGVVLAGAAADQGRPMRLGSARFCGVERPMTRGLHACLSDDQGWLATFELREDLREDAASTVAALRAGGLRLQLLSGDAPDAVARLARTLGIDDVRGGCSPQDKLAFLREAQAAGRRVAMVGDGLNDGPVLAGAHVSFALGQAVPLAQARSDFIVMGDRLASIAQTWALSRRTMRVVRQNMGWALIYNTVCVPLAMLGWLPAWLAGLGMALSSLWVVLNAWRLSRASALGENV